MVVEMTVRDRRHSGPSNVIVASHERSGTHFLINTLALNFDFAPRHVDSDISSGADFYIRSRFQTFLECLRHAGSGRIIKEHHHLAFFDGLLDRLREDFAVFYIYRNPADVMCSHWHYVRNTERQGPVTATPGAFMRAAPCGGMLRYQMEQQATVLDRWRSHVDAWTTLGAEQAGAITVAYEELQSRFRSDRGPAGGAARPAVPAPGQAVCGARRGACRGRKGRQLSRSARRGRSRVHPAGHRADPAPAQAPPLHRGCRRGRMTACRRRRSGAAE